MKVKFTCGILERELILIGISAGHVMPLEKEGNPPREVIVGVYIHRTLWEVILPQLTAVKILRRRRKF